MAKNELMIRRPQRSPWLLYLITLLMLMFMIYLLIWA